MKKIEKDLPGKTKTPTVNPNRQRYFTRIGILLLLSALFLLVLNSRKDRKVTEVQDTSSSVSVLDYRAEAKIIIQRAIEISDFIPDPHDKGQIKEALDSMVIYQMNKDGDSIKVADKFSLIIVPPQNMEELSTFPFLVPETIIDFSYGIFERSGQVLILMSDVIGALSHDGDVKALALIHALIHGLQAVGHGKTENKDSLLKREFAAWMSMTYLYDKLHPDIFKGAKCVCDGSLEIFERTKDQEKLFGNLGENIVKNMFRFSECKNAFLKKAYGF